MFGLFKKSGHLDCCLQAKPSVFPDGWFSLPVAVVSDCMWSDGKTVYYPDSFPLSEDYIWQDDQWIIDNAALIAAAMADKIKLLNTSAQAYIDLATETNKVPSFEVQTWSMQAAEAKTWAKNKSSPTPVLDQIATSRGVDPEKLKEAALRKTLAYEKLTAHIAGQRQALQSKIESAKTRQELDSIVIEFTSPEAV